MNVEILSCRSSLLPNNVVVRLETMASVLFDEDDDDDEAGRKANADFLDHDDDDVAVDRKKVAIMLPLPPIFMAAKKRVEGQASK